MNHLFSIKPTDNADKIESIRSLFEKTGASEATLKAIKEYTFKAFETLAKMDIPDDRKNVLKAFGENLMQRKV
ncbi:MAG: hypothetical protein EOO48_00910 [Flavobacterium sp.]|nr:MAG: hypothetical protein EOO48_00910 [Flavobacterium sp.]